MVLADQDPAQSWAESVTAYDKGRKTLAWKPQEFQPAVKIGNAERRRMERELDPVAMTFRDPAREAARTERKQDQMNATLSRVTGIHAGCRNIISGEGGATKSPPPKRDEGQPRDNHIICNMNTTAYKHCPVLYNEDFVEGNRQPRRLKLVEKAGKRDVDIINNKYYQNDKARKDAEYIDLRDMCIDRYWKGRDMNPVLQTYYKDDKEEKYQQQREALSRLHGGAKSRRLPLSIRYSEGASYDIVNHTEGDDPEKLKTALTMQIRTQNRQKKAKIEAELKDRGEALYGIMDARKLSRVSYARYSAQLERGYDPLKVELSAPLAGAVPRPSRPMTSWESLAPGGRNNGPGPASAMDSARGSARLPLTSGRNNDSDLGGGMSSARSQPFNSARGSGRGVPSLDLTKTDFGQKVTYSEPTAISPTGGNVKMSVRTGGRL